MFYCREWRIEVVQQCTPFLVLFRLSKTNRVILESLPPVAELFMCYRLS